jgi:transposase
MKQVSTIGVDIAKSVFQLHGVDGGGPTAHHWARELRGLGHDVRPIPPAYVKAYVRRNKNDAADAAAICEAVGRPSMRFVAVKTAAAQAATGLHKVRALLVKQRTMAIDALRGLMAEFGVVAAKGPQHAAELLEVLAAGDGRIPALLREALNSLAATLAALQRRIEAVERQIVAQGREDASCRRLIAIPGYGPILSSAIAAHVVDPAAFRSGRDFAASLGLTSRQSGTGGKLTQGPIGKRGNGYLRRLLVNGAMSVLRSRQARQDPWLVKLLERKPRKLVAVALANKMARIGWAVMTRQEDFPARPAAA